jgi:hypothetical protein
MIRFHTLGPSGSCHEHALKQYLAFQGVERADIALCDDLVAAAARAVEEGNSYVLQCSAHLNVHQVTERFLGRLHVVDTFILPTQEMALVKRRDVAVPRTLGVPEPALGYVNEADWRDDHLRDHQACRRRRPACRPLRRRRRLHPLRARPSRHARGDAGHRRGGDHLDRLRAEGALLREVDGKSLSRVACRVRP